MHQRTLATAGMANRTALLSRVAASLSGEDASEALRQLLDILREADVSAALVSEPEAAAVGAASNTTKRVVRFANRCIAWEAAPPLAQEDANLLESLLAIALLRVEEQATHRSSDERLAMLSAGSFEGILVHVDGVVIDANQRLSELLAYDREELLGPLTLPRCVAPEDLPTVLGHVQSRYEGAYTITGVRKDGSRFRAELQTKQGALGDRPVRVVAVRDVTERERREQLLAESEQRFQKLARAVFDVIVASREGAIVSVDGDVEALLGYPAAALVGRSLLTFSDADEVVRIQSSLEQDVPAPYEVTARHRDGSPVPVEVTPINSTLGGVHMRVSGIKDLRPEKRAQAERIALEQRIAQGQRAASLRVLAGGIAHDFNNLLLGLLGHAELLGTQLEDPEQQRAVQAIRTAGERAAALTAQMLAYTGRRELGEREGIDLGELLAHLHDLMSAALSKKARVSFALDARARVFGNRAAIEQVVMSLVSNASDSLPRGEGSIVVRSEWLAQLPDRWRSALKSEVPAGYVELSVSDDGQGMSRETMARAFEPFFTTKGGQGHGLGLAAVHGIARAHGGAVRVESTEGKGSCFSVLLPAAPNGPDRDASKLAVREKGQTSVLVVDDEPLVRSFLERALKHAGYTVQSAPDGKSALDALTHFAPDLLLLDMSLPDMDGAEILRRVRQAGHNMPVLLASGYLGSELESTLQVGTFQGFLQKPFRIDKLLRAVAETLQCNVSAQ